MSQKDTGFDAFFDAITQSKEFQKVIDKDWSGDLSKSLKDMEKHIAKAGEITEVFKNTFNTPEVQEIGNSLSTNQKSGQTQLKETKNAGDDERKISVTPEYFTMKNPDTWGFNGVAGLEKLKNELTDGFIRPLQFFFLVKNLKEKYANMDPSEIDTPEEKREKMLVDLHAAYDAFQVGIPTGMLLYGPPGTGKTFITTKLAQELGAGLITKSVGELGSSYLHETSKNIREFFDAAKQASENGPVILFLDEIDSLVSKRTNRVDANKVEEVSQFLQEFNKLSEAPNLIVVAATNRPDHLDSALLRSGRLDKKYYLGPPDYDTRKALFKINLENEKRPHRDINYDTLAKLSDGYVAADIEAIVEEAARDASGNILDIAQKLQENKTPLEDIESVIEGHVITQGLLEVAIADTVPSLKMVDMSVFDNWERKMN